MTAPLVSVVIPTYNAAGLLLQTLHSVFAQTFSDMEIIVVNDGSPDGTAAQLAQLSDPRLRVISQKNAGVGAARNRGLDEARGEFVAFLDHDDLWLPEKIATQIAFFRSHPQCAAVGVPWAKTTTLDAPEIPRDYWDRLIENPLQEMVRCISLVTCSALMVDREKTRGLRFSEERQCIEDTPYYLGIMGRGAYGIAGRSILMHYREHASNYSSQASFYFNGIRLLRNMQRGGEFHSFSPAQQQHIDEFISMVGRFAVVRQLGSGQRRKGMQLYCREWPHQWRLKRWRYLLGTLPLLVLPRSVAARRWAPRSFSAGAP